MKDPSQQKTVQLLDHFKITGINGIRILFVVCLDSLNTTLLKSCC